LTAGKQRGKANKNKTVKEVLFQRTMQFDSVNAMGAWLDMMSKDYYRISWVDWANKTITYQFKVYAHNDAEIQRAKESLENFYKSNIEVVQ
jgi:hypothetical protein